MGSLLHLLTRFRERFAQQGLKVGKEVAELQPTALPGLAWLCPSWRAPMGCPGQEAGAAALNRQTDRQILTDSPWAAACSGGQLTLSSCSHPGCCFPPLTRAEQQQRRNLQGTRPGGVCCLQPQQPWAGFSPPSHCKGSSQSRPKPVAEQKAIEEPAKIRQGAPLHSSPAQPGLELLAAALPGADL